MTMLMCMHTVCFSLSHLRAIFFRSLSMSLSYKSSTYTRKYGEPSFVCAKHTSCEHRCDLHQLQILVSHLYLIKVLFCLFVLASIRILCPATILYIYIYILHFHWHASILIVIIIFNFIMMFKVSWHHIFLPSDFVVCVVCSLHFIARAQMQKCQSLC